eukprot:220268_1
MASQNRTDLYNIEWRIRLSWNVNSHCLIYSRSKHKWFKGTIVKINGSQKHEWMVVKYDNNKRKKIQRNCEDIKPSWHSRSNNNYIPFSKDTKPSKLIIYSKSMLILYGYIHYIESLFNTKKK